MSANSSHDPLRLAPLIWLAQFGSVLLLMALTWFLPDLIAINPIAVLSQALLLVALLAGATLAIVSVPDHMARAVGGAIFAFGAVAAATRALLSSRRRGSNADD